VSDDLDPALLTAARAAVDPGLVVAAALFTKGVISVEEYETAKEKLVLAIANALRDVPLEEIPQRLREYLLNINTATEAQDAVRRLE
jgi:hypothetical protein